MKTCNHFGIVLVGAFTLLQHGLYATELIPQTRELATDFGIGFEISAVDGPGTDQNIAPDIILEANPAYIRQPGTGPKQLPLPERPGTLNQTIQADIDVSNPGPQQPTKEIPAIITPFGMDGQPLK